MNCDSAALDSETGTAPWFITLFRTAILSCVIATLLGSLYVANNPLECVLGFLGASCLLVISVPLFYNKQFYLFEPITLVILLVWFGTPLRIVYMLGARDADPHVASHVLFYHEPTVFLYPLFVVLVGLLCFVGGYILNVSVRPFRQIYLPQVDRWDTQRLQLMLLLIGAIATVCFLGFIATTGVNFGSMSEMSEKRFSGSRAAGSSRIMSPVYYLYRGASISKFVVYFGIVWLFDKKKSFVSWTGLWVVGFLLQNMLLSFVLDSRSGVILLLADCIILYFLLNKTISVRLVAICLLLIAALTIPMLASRGNSTDESPVHEVVKKSLTGRNMLDIAKTCHVINGVPGKMDYRYGQMLYGWMFAPIPKSVLPNKPDWSNQGVYLNQKIFGFEGDLSGCPPGLIGELYWDFGEWGVWIGLFIAGLVFRQLYLAFHSSQNNPSSVLIYTIIVSRFVMFSLGNDLGTGIVKSILDLIPCYVILLVIGRHRLKSVEPLPKSERPSNHVVGSVI